MPTPLFRHDKLLPTTFKPLQAIFITFHLFSNSCCEWRNVLSGTPKISIFQMADMTSDDNEMMMLSDRAECFQSAPTSSIYERVMQQKNT